MDLNLHDTDLLRPEDYPIKVVFNLISDAIFVSIIRSVSQGTGFGVEYGACVFPQDIDEYDKSTIGTFQGVQFGLHSGEDVTVSFQTFYYYLEKACLRYIIRFPQDKETISSILCDAAKRYKDSNNRL